MTYMYYYTYQNYNKVSTSSFGKILFDKCAITNVYMPLFADYISRYKYLNSPFYPGKQI